jgi:hypothetical protein
VWTKDLAIRITVLIVTVLASLALLAILDNPSEAQTPCMDETERERIREIVLRGIDKGLEEQITHLFEVWIKDPGEQPKRAMVGTANAWNAHFRARKQAIAWDPPVCAKAQ